MKIEKKGAKHNAVKHGIFANILLDGKHFGEERKHYIELISMLRSSIRPQNGLEETLVEKLAFLFLRLARFYRADMRVAPRIFERVAELLGPGQPSVKVKWVSREDQLVVVQRDPTSDTMTRYESNLERQIARTFEQIEVSQRLRGGNLTPALTASELDVPDG